jgi:DHA2 family multidrug resistance protein-like MFS transporter
MPKAVGVPAKPTTAPPLAALLGLAGASLAMELEGTVHSIAIVGAASALRMDGDERALAASIGTLCTAAFILATGSLGDRLGRKRVMLVGLAVSAAGGVITALATSTAQFAVGRALSGVGFAASFGLSFALLPAVAPEPAALARTVARWLALQGIGIVALCLLGGYLADVSWRLAYLLSPAVAVVALVWCLRTVPEAKDPEPGPFDAPGLLLVAAGLVGTLYGISNAASAGWTSTKVQVPLLVGVALLIAFARWEWRRLQPAFPIRAFADPQLMTGALASIGFNVALAVILLQLSLLWQYVYRYKPLEVSLGQLPLILACIVTAGWAGRLVARRVPMRRLTVIGLLAMAAAVAVLGFAGPSAPYVVFAVPLVVAGAGMMLTQAPAAHAFVGKAPSAMVGAIASSRTAFGQFGYALGLAVSSSLIYGMFPPLLGERMQEAGATPAEQAQAIGIVRTWVQTHDAPGFDARLVHEVLEKGASAYLASYRTTMLVMAGLVALVAVLCFWILSRRRSSP